MRHTHLPGIGTTNMLLAKLEDYIPAGLVNDRPAYSMISLGGELLETLAYLEQFQWSAQ